LLTDVMMRRSFVALCFPLLVACTVPRPPLPPLEQFVPPAEANFHERPEVIHFDPRQPYDRGRFAPPRFLHTEPGSNVVSPRNLPGASDAFAFFVIEKDGRVQQVKIIVTTGQPELDEAIENLVKRWRYAPGQLDGRPVAVAMGQIVRLKVEPGI
jgi:TonB family protein